MDHMKFRALVEKHRDTILAAEQQIWQHPETGFKEWQTTAFMEKVFTDAGYSLVKAGNIPGFYTDIDTGRPGPKLLILSELDALVAPNHFAAVNGCAHACGHNAQCAAMVGMALALKEPGALDGLSGSIRLMVVPAEELIEIEFRDELRKQGTIHYLGGKPEFMYRGYMDGVDLAYMFHTSSSKIGLYGSAAGANGCMAKSIVYEGRATHAGSPSNGINALYAATLGLQAVNSVRETFIDEQHIRVHPIVSSAGTSVNIIPAKAQLSSFVRGASMDAIANANRKVNRAFASGALAMGAKVKISDRPGYAPLNNSKELLQVAADTMAELFGAENIDVDNSWSGGSTDMGDLSCVMPVIHPHFNGAEGAGHSDVYHIANPENACVKSAWAQLGLMSALLENGAEKAKAVVAAYQPLYPTMQAYFEAMDALIKDLDAVEYTDSGASIRL